MHCLLWKVQLGFLARCQWRRVGLLSIFSGSFMNVSVNVRCHIARQSTRTLRDKAAQRRLLLR